MKKKRKNSWVVMLALLLMAAGAGLVLFAFRTPGRGIAREEPVPSVVSGQPEAAEEETQEPAGTEAEA